MTDTLNLGAGEDIQDDAHNVDVVDLQGINEVVDLNEYPWPWDDNSWRVVVAKHVLEHLTEPMEAMAEITRILEPGGELELWYPIGHTRFEDPTHRNFWNYNTAETLSGEREHAHEHADGLWLMQRSVDYSVDTRHWRAYAMVREFFDGPGPWLSQIPGLYGEVHATYRRTQT